MMADFMIGDDILLWDCLRVVLSASDDLRNGDIIGWGYGAAACMLSIGSILKMLRFTRKINLPLPNLSI